jgi:TolB-like protein
MFVTSSKVSIQHSHPNLRATAKLIDANTGRQIWSDRFDQQIEGIFKIRDESPLAGCEANWLEPR